MSALRPPGPGRGSVEGTVQGVGFRPYVYRLAAELGLAGCVLNDAHGVLLEVEGESDAVEEFLAPAGARGPAAGRDRAGGACPTAPRRRASAEFAIRPSPRGGVGRCARDPGQRDLRRLPARAVRSADRRYRYPFINCTNCGPRFTIVRGVPYDRPFTTMAGFEMCAACQAEYEDPADRRFHAQPNACPVCGPSVSAARRPPGAAAREALPTRVARRRRRSRRARSWPSRGSAATTWPAGPMTRPPWPGCGRASTGRTSRSR